MAKNERERAVFVISVAAELAGMHPQTLRIYERKGLLDPYRTPGGTRRYSQADLERLSLIQELTDAGLNLEGVKRVLHLEEEVERLRSKISKLERDIDEVQAEARKTVREQQQAYQIVLRSEVLPDLRRRGPRTRR
jgi:MerR family transcriptional regulator/heat shock protein HspR